MVRTIEIFDFDLIIGNTLEIGYFSEEIEHQRFGQWQTHLGEGIRHHLHLVVCAPDLDPVVLEGVGKLKMLKILEIHFT